MEQEQGNRLQLKKCMSTRKTATLFLSVDQRKHDN